MPTCKRPNKNLFFLRFSCTIIWLVQVVAFTASYIPALHSAVVILLGISNNNEHFIINLGSGQAVGQFNKEELKEDLTRLKTDIIKSYKDVIISHWLNNLVDKTVFIKLLDHILINI